MSVIVLVVDVDISGKVLKNARTASASSAVFERLRFIGKLVIVSQFVNSSLRREWHVLKEGPFPFIHVLISKVSSMSEEQLVSSL